MNADLFDDPLDRVLHAALPAPALPGGLRAAVRAAVQREAADALALQRAELEAERARQLAALRQGFVQIRRDTLAMVVGVAFTTGVLATVALPWLRSQLGLELSVLLPSLALTIGLAIGAGAWAQHLGGAAWHARWGQWRAALGF
ncbi:MAG: hypothetical protein IV094_09070 [Vitreoscilla sp.]|nr:hypothetical protein [Vitreoscilla sp.]